MVKKRIAVLRSDDQHHIYLSRLLQSRFEVVAEVVEPARKQRQRLLKIRRYKDYAYHLYHFLRRQIFGLDAFRKRYFRDLPSPPVNQEFRQLTIDWINQDRVVTLLKEVRPDLTVIICTSILRKKVLSAAGMVINLHGGYLPYYRGNYCFFLPYYHQEFDKIGSTIHFVNAGIDRGAIIENVVPPIYPADSPEKIYCRAEKLAIYRLAEWLDYWEQGGVLPRKTQEQKFKLHLTRDHKPYHDLHLWVRRITGRHQVPRLPGVPLKPLVHRSKHSLQPAQESRVIDQVERSSHTITLSNQPDDKVSVV